MFKFQRNQTKPKLIRIFLVTSIHRFTQQRKQRSPLAAEKHEHNGRVPFDQHFRKFRFKIEWNRNFPEIGFENFGSPLEVVLFSGNLEIPEIFCSMWHFYPVWIGPSSFGREKLQDGGESFELTLHWMQNDLPQLEPVLDRLSSTKTCLWKCLYFQYWQSVA